VREDLRAFGPIDALRWGGLVILLLGALTRATVGFEAFPYWSEDPTLIAAPMTALGPTGSMVIDAAILLGAGAGILGEALAGRGVIARAWAIGAVGCVPVILHARWGGELSIDDARVGVSWTAAVASGLAAMHLGRDPAMRRVGIAALLGLIGLLAAKGTLQVFVDHRVMVADFEANRRTFLEAHGWSEDSIMARSFVRRLTQPEATGWFGLANVFASAAATSTVFLAGLAVLAWHQSRPPRQAVADGVAGLLTIGAVVAAACVWLAGSKAGYAVTVLGGGLIALPLLSRRLPRRGWVSTAGWFLGLAVPAAVLAAVAARGVAGEMIGDRSVLFRWFYLQGASRVFIEHPLRGVGPDGFKQAYMLAKPALSPENVESPHSILFDYAARLGIAGLAWAGLFLWMVCLTGRTLLGAQPHEAAQRRPVPRPEVWVLVALASAPSLFSAQVEAAATTIESAAARAIGLVVWMVLSVSMLAVMRTSSWWERAAAAAALALAAHAQIELTGVYSGSAAWLFQVIGLAAAPALSVKPGGRRAAFTVAGGLACLIALLIPGAIVPVIRWESALAAASRAVEPVAELRARLTALSTGRPIGGDTIQRLAQDLGGLAGRSPAKNQDGFDRDLAAFSDAAMESASRELTRAAAAVPSHAPTAEALSRLILSRAALAAAAPQGALRQGASGFATAAEEVARENARRHDASASAWAWLGTVRAARAAMEGDAARHLGAALEAWSRAADLDPHGISFPMQAMEACLELGRSDEARDWAQRVLKTDRQLRLDPLLQLTDTQRARVERAAGR
jgi:tetratricopeptide (TPR) repeat protein